MKRLRLVFAAVALAVLLPLLLLIERALSSAAAEQALERRTVAERLIDEMERELTAFLRREEDRPFGHYRYLARPDDGPPGAPEILSPFTAALEPFVIGPFQLAPDGSASTPLWPDDLPLARRSGWRPNKEARFRADQVLAAIGGAFKARQRFDPGTARRLGAEDAAFEEAAEPEQLADQRAGSTVELEAASPAGPPAGPKSKSESYSSPLDLLEKLNRGAEARAERSSKLAKTQSTNLQQMETERLVDLRLEPMVGRPLDERRMLLYRTVFAGRVAYRQGLVIDRRQLVEWLAEKALAGAGGARVAIRPEGAPEEPAGEGIFRHRFAEPFAPVAALVEVGGAPGAALASARQLSALLLAAALLGLFALYRMAAYAVAYAQRRQDFVAAVTHELKTPLTAIRMYGEMLRDGMVAEESRKKRYYETIVAEGERLSRLVDNVLELARIERKEKTAALPPAATAKPIGPLLEEAAALLRPHAEKEGFTLELAIEPELPAVAVDRDLLLQIVFNLVDNALKYARAAADKKVTIGARRESGEVVVEIADRGPGVAPQHLRKIFEPFWRGENELTRQTKGTGIGLALVGGLARRMGGRASARNAPGGGFVAALHLGPAAASRTIPPP